MIYPRIKNLREDYDLTQEQMGEILHVSQRTYSHYEKGDREVPLEMLERMADYYDVSLDYLVGRSDEKEWLRPKRKACR